jgi:hypothetical protein
MDIETEYDWPQADWEPRSVRVWWFAEPTLLAFSVGNRIKVFDLYPAEMQALADDLLFLDCRPDYRRPAPNPDHTGGWYGNRHVCRPGKTIWAAYGWDGDWWSVTYLGLSFDLSKPEADELVRQYHRAMDGLQKVDWVTVGF